MQNSASNGFREPSASNHSSTSPDQCERAFNFVGDVYKELLAANGLAFFTPWFRSGLPTSIHELSWDHPFLNALNRLKIPPTVKLHSIVASFPGLTGDARTDGIVPYPSAHMDGVDSEKVVLSGHLCQNNPEVVQELRKILSEPIAGSRSGGRKSPG